jgi:hypothetical protein
VSDERDLVLRLLRRALALYDVGQVVTARAELGHLVEQLEAARAAEGALERGERLAGWGSSEWFQAREAERAGGDAGRLAPWTDPTIPHDDEEMRRHQAAEDEERGE